ncbi:MAG: TonB-dependent receptor [Proteobacteria bacterium]|nr:TonB-dependent receptor [Pseudomonadota bacterium]
MASVYARIARSLGATGSLAIGLLTTTALIAPASAEIEIVTVTAQKRVENNVNVPISITVNTAADLKNKNIGDLTELGQKIPNVNASGTFTGSFNIRGIATSSAGSGFPPDVGVNVDEVYMGRDRAFDTVLSDVASVEVLRGPQGTLYGKNTVAGVINITSNRPTNEYEAMGDIRYGNFDFLQARATVSGPIVEDKLLLRVTGSYQNREGYLDNTYLNIKQNSLGSWGGRAMLVYMPTSDLNFELRLDGYHEGDTAGMLETVHTLDGATCSSFPYNFLGCNAAYYSVVPSQNPLDRKVEDNTPYDQKRGMWGTSLKGEWNMANGYSLTSITAYRNLSSLQNADQDGSRLDGFDTGRDEDFRRFSQEVRIESPAGDRFSWLAGIYADSELDHNFYHIHVGQAFPTFLLGAPFPSLLPAGFSEAAAAVSTIQEDSASAFVSGKYNITDNLSISGGMRYTSDHKSLVYQQSPTTPIAYGVIFAFAENIPLTHATTSASELTGDANISYTLAENQVAYFRFAHGFKAGGFESDIISPPAVVTPSTIVFQPEYLNSYEVGFKSILFDNQLSANFAAFYYDFTNKQEQVNTGVSFLVSNAASATSKGVELELNWSPEILPGFSAFANFGYVDAKYGTFGAFTGKQLAGASPYSASWGASYTTAFMPLSNTNFVITTDWDYRDRAFTDPSDNPLIEVQSYMIINARIGFEDADGNWGIYAWGRNLGDKTVLGGGVAVLNNIYITRSINSGRTFGLELRGHI